MTDKSYSEAKNIILCSDGTGQKGGFGRDTNVWRTYDAIDVKHPDVKQLAFYDDGVGTHNNLIFKTLGLVFGYGLSKNIRQLYKFTVMHYKPGDQLYLFGFSRGSHTIRLLAELICTFGLLNPKSFDNEYELDKAIKSLQNKFKSAIRRAWIKNVFVSSTNASEKKFRSNTDQSLIDNERVYQGKLDQHIQKQNTNNQHLQKRFKNIKINFIGVWDTVSAVGMPIEEMKNNLFFAHHAFVDHKLNPNVKHACHALAIDEKRHTFKPELWDQSDEKDRDRIQQVWFPGVHANVGGGYPKDHLSIVSLLWMMSEASKRGLIFRESKKAEMAQQANHNGKMYDSRSGLSAFYRYKPRDVQQLNCHYCPNVNQKAKVHISTFQRIKDSSVNYTPVNIPLEHQVEIIVNKNPQPYLKKNYNLQKDTFNLINSKEHKETPISQKKIKAENNALNIICCQKILHLCFITFFYMFLLTGYQLTIKTPEIAVTSQQPTVKALQNLVKLINDSNPLYITNKLLPGYANHWRIALFMTCIFCVLMLMRHFLRLHLNNLGNLMWKHFPFDENRINANRLKSGLVFKMTMRFIDMFTGASVFNKKIMPSVNIKVFPILMTVLLSGLLLSVILYFFAPNKML